MKPLNNLLLIIATFSLSACLDGKVMYQGPGNGGAPSSSSSGSNGHMTNLNISGGMSIDVQPNATPIPSASPPKSGSMESGSIFLIGKLASLIIPSASAASSSGTSIDTYRLYNSTEILTKMSDAYGSKMSTFVTLNQGYLSSLEKNPNTPVPTELQELANLTFVDSSGITSSLVLPIVNLMANNATVITSGTSAYYGIGLIPGANSTTPAVALLTLADATYLKFGSSIKVFAGMVGGTLVNRNIATITFSGNTFAVNTSPTTLMATSVLYNAYLKPVSSELAAAASLSTSMVGYSALIAYVNTNNKIYAFGTLDLNSGVVSSASVTCSKVASYFSAKFMCN